MTLMEEQKSEIHLETVETGSKYVKGVSGGKSFDQLVLEILVHTLGIIYIFTSNI